MTKFLDLTIKIDGANKYKNDTKEPTNHRIIELAGPIKIKERNGSVISQIKDSSFGSRYSVNKIKFVKLLFSDLDIPISWAWENKKAAASIEFTLEKLKYDEVAGLEITHSNPDSTIKNLDTLVLNPNGFEVEQLEMRGEQFSRYWQMIKLAINNEGSTFEDFEKLRWKITKAYEDEQVANLVPEIKAWEKASILDDGEEYNFYNLVNINDGKRKTKEFCDFWLKKIEDLKEWKNYGIKTLIEADIAENNFFDITAEPGLKSRISSDAKYRGFSIINNEKQKVLTDEKNNSFNSNSDFQVKLRNRYNKLNIDCFRDCFSNDPDQTEPQYFRGFHVGEIGRINESFYSIYHQKDIKNKKFAAYLIEKDYTRTYYEFKSYFKFDENDFQPYQLLLIILRKEAFDEIQTKQQKTRKECLDIYWEWLKKFWPLDMIENKDMKNYYQKLTDLFSVLDKSSYANESKNNCETGLNILNDYETPDKNPLFPIKKTIKKKFSSEIDAKKIEITNQMETLFSQTIDNAANEEDYGSGQLNSERKKIFTTYRSQIENEEILAEIKELIRLLIEAEKIISKTNHLSKMTLANKLKGEYKDGQGDKKTAYTIVNQVDNQWVDRTITELEVFRKKDPATLLAEFRTQLKAKYNSAMAEAVFGNNILDSIEALETAEKLLIKVQEAQNKEDTDTSLLTFLQNYLVLFRSENEFTIKNKAWQAVNGYNKQAEAAIKHLQKTDWQREKIVKNIQEAKNENELEEAYNQIKNSDLYKQGDKSKKVIDNLIAKKEILFQIERENDISDENKRFFKTVLVKLIPDTIKNDQDERELTKLENQLKIFQNTPPSQEKGKIYQKYKNIIDQILTEIGQEKQRYRQVKPRGIDSGIKNEVSGEKPKINQEDYRFLGLIVIVGIISFMGVLIYYCIIKPKFTKKSKKI